MSYPPRDQAGHDVPRHEQPTHVAPIPQPPVGPPEQSPLYGTPPRIHGNPQAPMYGAAVPAYGVPQPPSVSPRPPVTALPRAPRASPRRRLLAFVYAALRIISCLILMVAAIRVTLNHDPNAAPQYIDVLAGLMFAALMTWAAVNAWTGGSTIFLLCVSSGLLVVSVVLVLAAVSPFRVSPPELVRAASAVLSLSFALTIIVLLGTALGPQPVRRVSWVSSVAGGIAIVLAVILLAANTEIVGPSVSMFLAFQLLILGILLILIRVGRGATWPRDTRWPVRFLNIAVALFGSFGLSLCGYDGASAFAVWSSHSQCAPALGSSLRNGSSSRALVSHSSRAARSHCCRCSETVGRVAVRQSLLTNYIRHAIDARFGCRRHIG